MSVQRVVAPLASSPAILWKFASSPTVSSLQPCRHVLRTFSSTQPARMSSKRKIQTSTAYHPSSLETHQPPPPRNVGIPDTSIAGAIPQVHDTRPPETARSDDLVGKIQEEQPTVSVTEQEAQKSKLVNSTESISSPATSSMQPRAKLRPKLRARKAAIHLTTRAVEQLRDMLDQPSPKLIKVGVRNRGCSGLAYHLEYVDKPGTFDETVEQDGVKVLVDSKALFSIIGSEMDWVEDKLNQRFVFKNPNIKEQCGCGESFMV